MDLNADGEDDEYSVGTSRSSTPKSSAYQTYVQAVVDAFGCSDGYFGYGCEKRRCAYQVAWTINPYLGSDPSDELHVPWGKADGTFGVRAYEECAGKGLCNRDTGNCKCFDGYTGKGCRYKTCPNDCGEHGVCQPAYVINSGYDADIPLLAQPWDREISMRCQCDFGYTGIDCSDRECPTGVDPVNPHDCPGEVDLTEDFAGSDQQLLRFPTAMPNSQYFYLEFESQFGGQPFRTRPVEYQSGHLERLAGQVQEALEALPNNVVPSCQTRVLDNDPGYAATILIAFTDAALAGRQKLLSCTAPGPDNPAECAGAQPKIDSVNPADIQCETSYNNDASELFTTYECSSRGECDRSSGKCDCHSGFEGLRCEKMFTFY